MTKAKVSRRLIAIICMVSMLCTMCFSDISVFAEDSATQDDITISTLQGQGFTYWTLSDVCEGDRSIAADNQTTADTLGYLAEGTLDKTIFSAKIGFPTGTTRDSRWHIGGKTDGTGFFFQTDANATGLRLQVKHSGGQFTVADFSATDAGLTTFRGDSELAVSLSVEYAKVYSEGEVEYADLKVGVFFNGKLYKNEYLNVEKVPTSELGKRVHFYSKSAYSMASNYLWEREAVTLTEADLMNQGYEYWTLTDVCEGNRTVPADNATNIDTLGVSSGDSLDKTIFTAKMNFSYTAGQIGRWYIGGLSDGKGFVFRASSESASTAESTIQLNLHNGSYGAVVKKFDPKVAGTALKGNPNLIVSLSVEYLAPTNNTDGYSNLKVGVFFDGKLYNNEYITMENVPTAGLGKRVQFYSKNEYAIASNYLWDRESTALAEVNLQKEDYEYWTLSDVGEADRTIAADDANGNDTRGISIGTSLDKTVFSAKMYFPYTAKQIGRWYIGGLSDGKGFAFRATSESASTAESTIQLNLHSGSYGAVVKKFDPKVAGTALKGNPNLIVSLSVEYLAPTNNTDGYSNLKVGVFFDGKLYNNEYITMENVPTAGLGKRVQFYSKNEYSIASNHLWERTLAETGLKEEGYEYWTLSDVNEADRTVAADGENNIDTNGYLIGTSLDMTVFSAKIEFPEETGDFGRWYIGGKTDGVGFCFRTNNPDASKDNKGRVQLNVHYTDPNTKKITGAVVGYFEPAVAGAILRGNSDLTVSLSVKYEPATNGTAGYTNMAVGVYFNGKLYNNQLFTVENVPTSDLAQRVYFYSENEYTIGSNHLWEREAEEEGLQEAKLKDQGFEYWTLSDMGIADKTIIGDGENQVYTLGNQIGTSLNKTVFTAKVSFPDEAGDFGRFYIGGVKEGAGFCFRNYTTKADGMLALNLHYTDPVTKEAFGVRLKEFYPGVAGTTLRDNTDLVVSLSVEYTKTYTENDVEYADLKVGVYFDGKLYNDEHIYVSKVPTSVLCRKTYFYSVNDYAYASNYLWAKSMSNYQAGLTELSASDFGLQDANVINTTRTGVYDNNTFDETAVTMMLTFPKEQDNSLYFGAANAGLRLNTGSSGSIHLSYVNAESVETKITTLNPGQVGLSTLTGANLKWQFVFLMNETWDNKTFLNVGVYIDGKLYGDGYFLLEEVDSAVLKRVVGIDAANGSFTIADLKYTELSFCDFNIMDTRLETVNLEEKPEGYKKADYYDYETLDNTAFTGIYNFPSTGSARFVLGDAAFWHGIIFQSKGDGNIRVQHVDADNASTVIVDITPEKAGVDALVGKDVEVRMTFDVMEISEGKADVKLGIYINGRLYDGQHYVVNDVHTSTLTRFAKLWAMNGPYEIKSVVRPGDLSIYGFSNANYRKELGIK